MILYSLMGDEEITMMKDGYEEFRREAVVESMGNSPSSHTTCETFVACALHYKSCQI